MPASLILAIAQDFVVPGESAIQINMGPGYYLRADVGVPVGVDLRVGVGGYGLTLANQHSEGAKTNSLIDQGLLSPRILGASRDVCCFR